MKPEFGMETYAAKCYKYAVMRGAQGVLRSQMKHYLHGVIPRDRLEKHDKDKARKLDAYTNGLVYYVEIEDRIYQRGGTIRNARRLTDDDWVHLIRISHRKRA